MFYFSEYHSPAFRAHLSSHRIMLEEFYKQVFAEVQKITDLHVQMTQTFLGESTRVTQQLLSSRTSGEALSILAGQIQPAVERLRAYPRHMVDIGTQAQLDLTKSAQSHIPQATRTAQELADEVGRLAAEEAEKVAKRQMEALQTLTAPLHNVHPKGNGGRGAAKH